MQDRPPIIDLAAAVSLFAHLADGGREQVAIAYLDPKRRILGLRHIVGGMTQATVPIRQVARDALAFDAAAVVMAHTHPSGDPTPSERDVAFTVALAMALRALDVTLIDHLVIAGGRVESLRAQGVL